MVQALVSYQTAATAFRRAVREAVNGRLAARSRRVRGFAGVFNVEASFAGDSLYFVHAEIIG
jgi:hypothetical protein